MSNLPYIFIIEPSEKSSRIFDIFSQLYPNTVELIRYQTLNQAEKNLQHLSPALVVVSSSFSPVKTVEFLEHFKNTFVDQLIPLIFVIDFSLPITKIVGTHWGNKVGVLTTLSSKEEVKATLQRLEPKLPVTS